MVRYLQNICEHCHDGPVSMLILAFSLRGAHMAVEHEKHVRYEVIFTTLGYMWWEIKYDS